MEIKTFTQTQKAQISKAVNQWTKDNFEDYFKAVSSDYVKVFEGVDFKEFAERIEELILDGFENSTPTILSDHYFYCEEANQRANNYLEEMDDHDTDDLLSFDEDKAIFNIEYYGEDDYYLETLNTLFDTKDISKYFKNSYSDYFIQITDENVNIDLKDEAKYYEKFEDLLEDFEGNMLYNIDKEMLLLAYFEAFKSEVFKWFVDTSDTDKETRETIKKIEAQIPKVLKARGKALSVSIKKQRETLRIFRQLTKDTISRKNQAIMQDTKEANEIKARIKGAKK